MVDAHAHLDRYGEDLPRALAQIRDLSVWTLAVSMDIASYGRILEVAGDEPLILPSFGIHPWEAPRFADDLGALAEPLADAALIGEIGLDHRFVEDERLYPAQRVVFEHFLDVAEGTHRLVNLHTTGAETEVLEALRSKRIRALAERIPEDRLLTETDNPGGWEWMTGEPGFPELIESVEREVAEIRGVPRERLAAVVEENFRRVLEAGGIEVPGAEPAEHPW